MQPLPDKPNTQNAEVLKRCPQKPLRTQLPLITLQMCSHNNPWRRNAVKQMALAKKPAMQTQNTTNMRGCLPRRLKRGSKTQIQNATQNLRMIQISVFMFARPKHATPKRNNGVRCVSETPKTNKKHNRNTSPKHAQKRRSVLLRSGTQRIERRTQHAVLGCTNTHILYIYIYIYIYISLYIIYTHIHTIYRSFVI